MRQRDVAEGRPSPMNYTKVAGTHQSNAAEKLTAAFESFVGMAIPRSHASLVETRAASLYWRRPVAPVNSRNIETTSSVGGSAGDTQVAANGESDSPPPLVQDEFPSIGNYALASPLSSIHVGENAVDDVDEQESMSVRISVQDHDGASLHTIGSEITPSTLCQGGDLHSSSGPRVGFLEPNIPRSDSPVQYCAEFPSMPDEIAQSTTEDICHSVLELEKSLPGSDNDTASPAHPPKPSVADVQVEISRKILIIGGDYRRGARRTSTISSAITLESPSSDKEQLGESFRPRGYSVHSMVNNYFDRNEALVRVSSFLSTARCRDVRAIMFMGHAAGVNGQGRPALVPPNYPDPEMAIPAELWESTIRENTQPGVIVLSIFASCFSEDFMQQEIDLKVLNQSTSDTTPSSTSTPGPILLTSTLAAPDQLSCESPVETEHPWGVANRFLDAFGLTYLATIDMDRLSSDLSQRGVTLGSLNAGGPGSDANLGATRITIPLWPQLPETPEYYSDSIEMLSISLDSISETMSTI
ncbi:hypothetical protein FRC06_001928 [Ceratobasidium sp. 370]|nr:hypothetical protein FRC06_001928 [Ceratobasidium sp. 370]